MRKSSTRIFGNGNVISRQAAGVSTTYAYDAENRLISVLEDGQLITEYGYDGDGNRVWEKDYEGYQDAHPAVTVFIGDHTEISWDGIEPYNGSPELCIADHCLYLPLVFQNNYPHFKSYYYAGGQRIAIKEGSQVYYLLGDHLGSTSAVADRAGNLVARTLYEPWGETRFEDGESPTDYAFTGQMVEGDLYYYGARWYDPLLGRFVQPDTIVPSAQGTQAFDRYAYVNNNPLRYTDPSGHCIFGVDTVVCITVGLMIAGAVTGYGIQVYDNMQQGMDFSEALTTNITLDKIWSGAVIGGGFAVAGYATASIVTTITTIVNSNTTAIANTRTEAVGTSSTNAYDNLSQVSNYWVKPYSTLQEELTGIGLQAHHLIEKRLAPVLGYSKADTANWPSVAVTPEEHQVFTNLWRSTIGYSNAHMERTTNTTGYSDIIYAAKRIYSNYPALLNATRNFLEYK
jgi:RHS repeat-associated protein